jgi:DNA topoisomerase-2
MLSETGSVSDKSSNKKTVEEKYKHYTDHEHILKLPDTYIGGIEEDDLKMWVYDEERKRMMFKTIKYIPGLYKIFDEIMVNARDHYVRDKTCNEIQVTINEESGEISVFNNGDNGIEIEYHNVEKCYVPEMIFSKIRTSQNYEEKGKIVGGKNGLGSKCISSDTLVPTWNGIIKRADHLTLSDKLIGDDGKIRNIKKIITGSGTMYEIMQKNGEPYKVNDQHILTLSMSDHKVIQSNSNESTLSVSWWDNVNNCINTKTVTIPTMNNISDIEVNNARHELQIFCKTIPDTNIFDISIQDYMKLDNETKMKLTGICGECVQWDKKEVLLDPYFLGLWLGKGMSDGYRYMCNSKNDFEVIDYLTEWCNTNDCKFIQTSKENIFSILYNNHSSEENYSPLVTKLTNYNLIKNKHIPLEYIVNDKDTRLNLLAGLIDSSGCIQKDSITIYRGFNDENLVNDITLLVHSLGLNCSSTIIDSSYQFDINIFGNIERIPTRLLRNNYVRKNNSERSTGQIEIKEVGLGNYIGFEIDNNQRFLINDFTVTHNCTNIYSNHFFVDVVDGTKNLKYTQHFHDNMYKRDDPIIEKIKGKNKSHTKITFLPDYKRFGVDKLTPDMASLFKKRVYDMAAVTNVKVSLNDEIINIKDFEDYIRMFYEDGEIPSPPVYEVVNDRWKIGVVYDPNSGFRQISYVNGICTFQGGSHITHVLDQVVGGLYNKIISKNKTLKIKTSTIKDNLSFFIDAVIEDPGFSSQTKESLTTKVTNFGSKCLISEDFINKLSKTGIVEEVVSFAKFRAMEDLKKTDGKKKQSLKGLAKLDDAHWAGTKKSKYCTLILTEGDSAKSFAIDGLDVVGRERFGVFPLRGKLLNVREATAQQLLHNEEISNIKQIMGLKHGKKYKNVNELRYGRILVLTDQDYDGSHIKGLIINFIQFFWPSLIQIDGFVSTLKTYIAKVFKKSDIKKQNGIGFYTLTDFEKWKIENASSLKSYTTKYYKGLGSSKDGEPKEAFIDFDKKVVSFIWSSVDKYNKEQDKSDEDIKQQNEEEEEVSESENTDGDDDIDEIDKSNECYDAITLAFAKTRANDRKKWLEKYDRSIILDNNSQNISYYDFVHKDLIHFSNYDNERSIPSVCDGFKPSQRKIIYGSILKNIFKDEIKVAQLSGYISEKTGYHHGETSLQAAITALGQNFVGSNNINWLLPNGNFGNRRMGGKNAASARYICTQLNELVSYAFKSEDNCILRYMDDDGIKVEPEVYAPVICGVLINGAQGIGTGFSTTIPSYNPKDIISNQRRLINNQKQIQMIPYYKGFKGSVVVINNKSFETHGVYEIIDENTIIIDELPIGTWTEDYKAYLDSLVVDDIKKPQKGQILKKFIDDCGNNKIKFTLIFMDDILQDLVKKNEVAKKLKLINKHSTANMHTYDVSGKIKKYDSVSELLYEYYVFRLEMYEKRKQYYLKVLENKLNILGWKIKFLDDVINGKLIIFENKKTRSKQDVIKQLETSGFPKLSNDIDTLDDDKTYNYLINISIFDLTDEERNKLKDEYAKKMDEFNAYKNVSVQDIWLKELDEFEELYDKWIDDQELNEDGKPKLKKAKAKAKAKGNANKKPVAKQ